MGDRDADAFEKELTLREPSRTLTAVSTALMWIGAFFIGVVAFAALTHSLGKGAGPGPLGFDLLVAGGILRWARNGWRTKKRQAKVRADAQGVHVDGKLVLARGEILQGTFQPGVSVSPSVILRGKRRKILFNAEVADEAEALEFLHALGLDAQNKRADFHVAGNALPRPTRSLILGSLAAVGFALSIALHTPIAIPITGLAMIATVIGLAWPGNVVVGADGILVKRMFGERFIPMADVKGVSWEGLNALIIELTSGENVRVVAGNLRTRSGEISSFVTAQRNAIVARIEEALAVHRAHVNVDVAALVRRGERSGAEWLAELKKLRDRAAGYRDLVLRDEDLWQLVEDPGAGEDARAAAALILRPKLDDDGKKRIRIAADATASPKLRVALESATSDGEEAEIERAIAEAAGAESAA